MRGETPFFPCISSTSARAVAASVGRAESTTEADMGRGRDGACSSSGMGGEGGAGEGGTILLYRNVTAFRWSLEHGSICLAE